MSEEVKKAIAEAREILSRTNLSMTTACQIIADVDSHLHNLLLRHESEGGHPPE